MSRKKLYVTKRLSILIPLEVHKEIERIAIKRNETMTRIVLQAISERLCWEKRYE